MAVARTSIFLLKRFCLIYLLNLSIYLFIFYTVIFFSCFITVFLCIYYYNEYVDLFHKKGILLIDTFQKIDVCSEFTRYVSARTYFLTSQYKRTCIVKVYSDHVQQTPCIELKTMYNRTYNGVSKAPIQLSGRERSCLTLLLNAGCLDQVLL